MEEIIKAEREYLINVLGKQLLDISERDDRTSILVDGNYYSGYVLLARKYWPEEFKPGETMNVHHIDFDRSNNAVSNLVVLTPSQHVIIHHMFDPSFVVTKEKLHKMKNRLGQHNTDTHNKKIGQARRNMHRVYNPDGTFHMEQNEK